MSCYSIMTHRAVAILLMLCSNAAMEALGQRVPPVWNTPHDYYTAHIFAMERGEGDVHTEWQVHFGDGMAPTPDGNTVMVYAKQYGGDGKAAVVAEEQWDLPRVRGEARDASSGPTAFVQKNEAQPQGAKASMEVHHLDGAEDETSSNSSGGSSQVPKPNGCYIFLDFYTPTANRRLSLYEQVLLEEEGEEVAEDKRTTRSKAPLLPPPPSRQRHVWAFPLPSPTSVVKEKKFEALLRLVTSFIFEKDLETVPKDFIEKGIAAMRKRFERRFVEWHCALQGAKEQQAALQNQRRRSGSNKFMCELEDILSMLRLKSKQAVVDHFLTSGALGRRDPLHSEILCDVDTKTARRMAESRSPGKKRRDSDARLHMQVVAHLGSGTSGEVFEVKIRPDGEVTPGSALDRHRVIATATGEDGNSDGYEYSSFAMKLIDLKKATTENEMFFNRLYNELLFAHAIEHPNVASVYYVCKPNDEELALIMELAAQGDVQNLYQTIEKRVWNATTDKCPSPVPQLYRFLFGESALGLHYLHSMALSQHTAAPSATQSPIEDTPDAESAVASSPLLPLIPECKALVYGDLKPKNLLWDGDFHFRLGDFGTIGCEGQGRTTWTYGYASPNARRSEPRHRVMDIWAMGVISFVFVTQHFPGETYGHVNPEEWPQLQGAPQWKHFPGLLDMVKRMMDHRFQVRKEFNFFEQPYFGKGKYLRLLALRVVRPPMITKSNVPEIALEQEEKGVGGVGEATTEAAMLGLEYINNTSNNTRFMWVVKEIGNKADEKGGKKKKDKGR